MQDYLEFLEEEPEIEEQSYWNPKRKHKVLLDNSGLPISALQSYEIAIERKEIGL